MKECGVTIIKKQPDETYEIVARYDMGTDSVASQIMQATKYKNHTETPQYEAAAMIYYEHMAYLTRIMNYVVGDSFETQDIEIYSEKYSYNQTISYKINDLYKYKDSSENEKYGTDPWSNNIAKRLECDFSGKEEMINGLSYNNDELNLFNYLKGKNFKEYIVEVNDSAELLKMIKEQNPEDADKNLNTNINSSTKLEIIYVEQ